MHPKMFELFQKMAELYRAEGPVLEVGAAANDKAIISGPYFAGMERHAVNIQDRPQREGILFHRCDANDMRELFADDQFGTVLSNAVLEHDKRFWLSIAEMKRVLKPGGALMIGVPGFTRTDGKITVANGRGVPIKNAAITIAVHAAPDYWRISPQAMKEVILDGLQVRMVRRFLVPPRIFGLGYKPV